MDYKVGSNNRQPKRKARNISEMLTDGDNGERRSRRIGTSGYSGPKRSAAPTAVRDNGQRASYQGDAVRREGMSRGPYTPPIHVSPLAPYAWMIFTGILGICLILTIIVSGISRRTRIYNYPRDIFTMSGLINTVYDNVYGSKDKNAYDLSSDSSASSAASSVISNSVDPASLTDVGEQAGAVTLDDGTVSLPGYTSAASHSDLITQLDNALSQGEYAFVGTKLAYEDAVTGQLTGYPESVISEFTSYMQDNADKRSSFISAVSGEDYSATNGTAYILKLPLMKFTVKLGANTGTMVLDNTVISLSGFSDVVASSNQNAEIYPLLPCMYTLTLSNSAWPNPSQSQEIECTLGEGNLDITVGVQDQ